MAFISNTHQLKWGINLVDVVENVLFIYDATQGVDNPW